MPIYKNFWGEEECIVECTARKNPTIHGFRGTVISRSVMNAVVVRFAHRVENIPPNVCFTAVPAVGSVLHPMLLKTIVTNLVNI
jgi:hypothetical protein